MPAEQVAKFGKGYKTEHVMGLVTVDKPCLDLGLGSWGSLRVRMVGRGLSGRFL